MCLSTSDMVRDLKISNREEQSVEMIGPVARSMNDSVGVGKMTVSVEQHCF